MEAAGGRGLPARAVGVTAGLRYGVEVRSAQAADAAEVARLLSACGVAVAAPAMADRLEAIRTHGQAACLVSTGYDGLSGLVALCWAPVLHQPRPVACVTAFVVAPDERRRGIGRMLVKAASQAARAAGCDLIELAAPPGETAVAAFCRTTGFLPQGEVYSRSLRKRL